MSDYPKTYRHPVTEQERSATNASQEVSLKFDGYRLVEPKAPAKDSSKAEDSGSDKAEGDTSAPAEPPAAPKSTTPKPSAPKGQEGK